MKQISGNKHINEQINLCFGYLFEEDVQKFISKFRSQPEESDDILHVFRELVLGAFLNTRGFEARYEYLVDTQTPDWCLLDEEGVSNCVIECTNFHLDVATELEIKKRRQEKDVVVYWRDENKDNVERLYQCLWRKAIVYKLLIEKLKIPYVIGLFSDLKVDIDSEEIEQCLYQKDSGIFEMYPKVSGVLHFFEYSGRYSFSFFKNQNATYSIEIPNGIFPPPLKS